MLAAAVLFNFALAWINGNVRPVTAGQLVAVQGVLLAAALGLGALRPGRDRATWLLLLWAMLVWWMGLSLLRQSPQLKYLGDVAAFPAFALLGAAIRPRRFIPLLVALQIVVVSVGLWEALDPEGFGQALDVPGYYVNTRGLEADQFREETGGLFLNAQRPGGRLLLPGTGWNRVSSVFLEPVSLGNWTIVVTVLLAAFWRRVSVPARVLLIAGNAMALVMCDGRLAILGCALVIALALVARHVPRFVPLLMPVLGYGALAAARALDVLPLGGDTFAGRLSKGMLYFERLSLTELMGAAPDVPGYTFDSGWAYFAMTQGVLGFAAFWTALVLLMPWRGVEARRFLLGCTLFFTLSMPISNAFLSIKAAALLFACYGSLRRWGDVEERA